MEQQIIADSLAMCPLESLGGECTSLFSNVWFWIAVVEFLVICVLLFYSRSKSRSKKSDYKMKAKSAEIDFSNVIESAFKAKPLYHDMIRKCHPDRFPMNPEKIQIATELSLEIGKNKNNLKRLLELKKEAEEKLDIHF